MHSVTLRVWIVVAGCIAVLSFATLSGLFWLPEQRPTATLAAISPSPPPLLSTEQSLELASVLSTWRPRYLARVPGYCRLHRRIFEPLCPHYVRGPLEDTPAYQVALFTLFPNAPPTLEGHPLTYPRPKQIPSAGCDRCYELQAAWFQHVFSGGRPVAADQSFLNRIESLNMF